MLVIALVAHYVFKKITTVGAFCNLVVKFSMTNSTISLSENITAISNWTATKMQRASYNYKICYSNGLMTNMLLTGLHTCLLDNQSRVSCNMLLPCNLCFTFCALNTIGKLFLALQLCLPPWHKFQRYWGACLAHTCSAASTIFHSTVACLQRLAVLEMCNNLEKLTRRYFLPSHLWLRRFNTSNSRLCFSVSTNGNFNVCIQLIFKHLFTSAPLSFFLSPFLSFAAHNSQLPTQPFSSTARRRKEDCVGTNMRSAEANEGSRKRPNGRSSLMWIWFWQSYASSGLLFPHSYFGLSFLFFNYHFKMLYLM